MRTGRPRAACDRFLQAAAARFNWLTKGLRRKQIEDPVFGTLLFM